MSQPESIFTAGTLTPGRTYRVKIPFKDYDGDIHPVGETWRYVKKRFLPYEDGLTLSVEQEGRPWDIRLQWREETQGQIIDHFSGFVEALPENPPGSGSAEAKKARKPSFWRHIAVGAAILYFVLCLIAAVVILVLAYEMGYRPARATDRQPPTLTAALNAPPGQDCSLVMVSRLQEIDLIIPNQVDNSVFLGQSS